MSCGTNHCDLISNSGCGQILHIYDDEFLTDTLQNFLGGNFYNGTLLFNTPPGFLKINVPRAYARGISKVY
jgi:hypothetical protein